MTLPFELLFIDNHLIAVNKPAGMLTQPAEGAEESVEAEVKQWLKHAYHKPGAAFLGTVHRLDRPVSGVLLFARTSKALTRLNQAVRAKQFQKTYWALVEGHCTHAEGVFEDCLLHGEHHAQLVQPEHPEAKQARLYYKVLQRYQKATLMQIQLETGRYHQIRLQFASRGMPILGDKKYGSKTLLPDNQIALHHRQLSFCHPIGLRTVTIEAPLPAVWATWEKGP
jgi:23S rRNA pseudouridine1911/1915/1917 synthase